MCATSWVGGEAVIRYGYARLTADMDLFFDRTVGNARRLHDALAEFWGGSVSGIKAVDDLRVKGRVFQFGLPPNRLEQVRRRGHDADRKGGGGAVRVHSAALARRM